MDWFWQSDISYRQKLSDLIQALPVFAKRWHPLFNQVKLNSIKLALKCTS